MIQHRPTRGENAAFCHLNDAARVHVQQVLLQQSQPGQNAPAPRPGER